MIKLLEILLVTILYTSSSLDARVLQKRDLPFPTDFGQLLSDSIGEDDQTKYFQDYNGFSSPTPFLDVTIDVKELEKSQDSQIQKWQKLLKRKSSLLSENDDRDQEKEELNEELKYVEKESNPSETLVKEDYENYHKQEEIKKNYEEYGNRKEEKPRKPETRLFGPSIELQLRENLEQFKRENLRLVQFQLEDHSLRKIQRKNSELRTLHEKPSATSTTGSHPSDNSHFSYNHPEEWSLYSPECSGRLQSPVNFDSDKLVGLDLPSSLIWTGYWNQPENLSIMDNGHSVEVSGFWGKKSAPFISGGPLIGDYLFAQLHFHWGPKDSVGSEHTIDNKSFPMEMHMVHYKRDYQTLKEALEHDDGLAVVAFLFEISESSNFGINLLEDSLNKIKNNPLIRIPVQPYPLALFHFAFQQDYASYIGSLTTPPCREIVTWLVSSSPLTVTRKQLDFFRDISNKWSEKENYRPRQALNGRRLYYVEH